MNLKEIEEKHRVQHERTLHQKPLTQAYAAIEEMNATLPIDHVIINSCFNPVKREKQYMLADEVYQIWRHALKKIGISDYKSVCCVEYCKDKEIKGVLDFNQPHLHTLISIHKSQENLFKELDILLNSKYGDTSSLSNELRTLDGSAIYNTGQLKKQCDQSTIEPIFFKEISKTVRSSFTIQDFKLVLRILTAKIATSKNSTSIKGLIKPPIFLTTKQGNITTQNRFQQLVKFYDDS